MELDVIKANIRQFIDARLSDYGNECEYQDTDSLIHSGLLDSLAIIYLIMHIEKTFAVDFSDHEFDPDEFDTLDAISQVVQNLAV